MIVKYHNRGVGCGAGPVQYLLGKDYDRENAELLRGDPDATIDLIDSLEFKKTYTSGLLSFTETDLSEEVKNKIMDDFEKATFCGMEQDQYSIMWVQHLDKNNLELNFVIPNVELNTGKRFQPYFDKADRPRINQFRDITNLEHGFSNPKDIERQQALNINNDLPRDKKEIVEQLNNFFLQGIEKGSINDRNDIKESLTVAGVKIARETDKSISIENPNGGQNIRLKGAIYERSFRADKQARRERQDIIEKTNRERGSSLEATRERYQKSLESKSKAHEKIYKNTVSNDKSISSPSDFRINLSSSRASDKESEISIPRTQINKPGVGYTGVLEHSKSEGRGQSSVLENSQNSGRLRMGREPIYAKKGLTNDRDRNTFNERFRDFRDRSKSTAEGIRNSISDFRERARSTAEGIRTSIKGFTSRIQESISREQKPIRQSSDFGRQINDLDKAIKQEEIALRKSMSRSMSISYDTGRER